MEIDLDVEMIRNCLLKQVFNITDMSDNYAQEWKTVNCINNAFESLTDIVQQYEAVKSTLIDHLNELDNISSEAVSKIDDVVSLISSAISKYKNDKGGLETALSDQFLSSNNSQTEAKSEIINSENNKLQFENMPIVEDQRIDNSKSTEMSISLPSPEELLENNEINKLTATVTTKHSALNVRTGKGTDKSIKTSAPKGSKVTIIESDDGSGWTKVRLENGTEGYVASKYITKNSSRDTSSSLRTNVSSTANKTSMRINIKAKVNTNQHGLNLRESANGNIITSIPKGTQIDILERDNGNGWTKVRFKDKTGYVSTKWLSIY